MTSSMSPVDSLFSDSQELQVYLRDNNFPRVFWNSLSVTARRPWLVVSGLSGCYGLARFDFKVGQSCLTSFWQPIDAGLRDLDPDLLDLFHARTAEHPRRAGGSLHIVQSSVCHLGYEGLYQANTGRDRGKREDRRLFHLSDHLSDSCAAFASRDLRGGYSARHQCLGGVHLGSRIDFGQDCQDAACVDFGISGAMGLSGDP